MIRPTVIILGGLALITVWRGWLWLCDRTRIRRVPGLPCDGRPLSVIEAERFGWIEDGYGQTAREPGRQR